MKHLKIIILFIVCVCCKSNAQTSPTPNSNKGFQLSMRAGYDKPLFSNNVPYLDYKSGPEFGASVDYYWSWIGLGFDFDYINNGTKNNYQINNLSSSGGIPLTSFTIQEDKLTRLFYGIGPDFRYQSSNRKFQAELNTRIGLSSIKGGKVEVKEITTLSNQLLNFHAGYDLSSDLATKAQVRFTYFFSKNFGFHAGAYYIKHFDGTELVDASNGISAGYSSLTTTLSGGNTINNTLTSRANACNCDLASVGVFAGLTIKFNQNEKSSKNDVEYSLVVTAKDKFTKELLPNTDIVIKNKNGDVIQTGSTNNFGVIVFNKMIQDDYVIEGKLYDVNLDNSTITKSEFRSEKKLQKEILYSDLNFILKGKAVVCNSTKALNGVSVILKNNTLAEQKNTITDKNGEFIFSVNQNSEYEIYGRKEKYFSQTENVITKNYNRNTTLFVKLEVCLEEADCGKAFGLKNILYDLGKFEIKVDAKKELNRLVVFMQDNPTFKIEVSSHTDCRSSDEYNKTLSQNRANASVDYIISQGISASRISGVGYGESKLLNKCSDGVDCSEAEHAINRRTEMKILCN